MQSKGDFDEWYEEEKETDEIIDALICELASSSDEEDNKSRPWGGDSCKGKAPNKNRNFHLAYTKLVHDYFNGPDSVYDEEDFERRF